ncbi:hypothetical protein [Acinetobacter soli]|uniref:hypothetical protein n=1 Tax=Acinetobacter soli TaxID=487316 RepID=UPI00124CBF38|nr:hypothetical protein [Acinetobacter soli]
MIILFQSIKGRGYYATHRGFLVIEDGVTTVEDIYWRVDELGFDPYSVVFRNSELMGGACWVVSNDEDIGDINFGISEEFRFASSMEYESQDEWMRIRLDGNKYIFEHCGIDGG